MKIFTILDYYLPGNKAGGPIFTIQNLINNLYNDNKFYIFTRDRDLGDEIKYTEIEANKWDKEEKYSIFYTPIVVFPKTRILLKEIKNILPDIIYLNSLFSPISVLVVLLRLFKIINSPILLAPKGELYPGFLEIRKFKKNIYIKLSNLIGSYKNIYFHASTNDELEMIKNVFGQDTLVLVAEDIAELKSKEFLKNRRKKRRNNLKICWISRIHEKKNLHQVIKILKNTDISIELNIYGPIHDQKYWNQIQTEIKKMSSNIIVNYKGSLSHDEIYDVFLSHDVFLFLTFGENYGHVILESLMCGCPVILSNTTPWNHLQESGGGWVYDFNSDSQIIDKLSELYHTDDEKYKQISENAYNFAEKELNNQKKIDDNKQLFIEMEKWIKLKTF